MPKQQNHTIGRCRCRVSGCDEIADVRRMKNHERGALYLVCPVHGTDRTSGHHQNHLDQWVENNMIGAEPDPDTSPEQPAPVPDTVPPANTDRKPDGPEPTPTGPGFLSRANKQLGAWFDE